MLYAPNLGPTGLDVSVPRSRDCVFHTEVHKTIRPTRDFHPEVVSYSVFSIMNGMLPDGDSDE